MTARVNYRIRGIGVSPGIQIAEAFVYRPFRLDDVSDRSTEHTDEELIVLERAKQSSIEELETLIEQAKTAVGDKKAVILKGQISLLNDPAFFPVMQKFITDEKLSAGTAVKRTVEQTAKLFEAMASEYMRERAADVRDVGGRLAMHAVGYRGAQLSNINRPVILVADDLAPSDTVQLNKEFVRGIVTRVGGRTSHTAILAHSLGIAAVLGTGDGLDDIHGGEELIVDGETGECIVNPDDSVKEVYSNRMQNEQAERKNLEQYAERKAVTLDGFEIEAAANIGTPEEAVDLLKTGAEAVGLYRTEFLFMSAQVMPCEDTQYHAYRESVEAMQGRPVVIRTLDIGGDKELPYLQLPHEMNPFLGYRAIRLCLDRRELLRTQLRAIMRASAHGDVKIMFPMISGLEEWRAAKAAADQVRQELMREGTAVADRVEIGIMIEVPSAAIMADAFAREVDFFSIGTNDLVQYTIAVDRMNEKVAPLYDYFHPAVIRLIKKVIDAANKHGIWAGMCGSMASDPLAAPLLLGLGLKEWSMAPSAIRKMKKEITELRYDDCRQLAEKILDMGSAAEIRGALTAARST